MSRLPSLPSSSLAILLLLLGPLTLAAQDEPKKAKPAEEAAESAEGAKEKDDVLAGHSYHGEAFNEGPRQKAYLMQGMPEIHFPVTSKVAETQQFIEQGVGQLHGFWAFEAERSFRQAAALDPDCAMAYWGMAMANSGNAKRAKGFIAEAVERKEGVSQREKMYIDMLKAYIDAGNGKKKERSEAYIKALEKLIYEYPEDIEARALLALQLWKARSDGLPIQSYLAVDALLQQVFEKQPMHPAHHYRIHLWDYQRAETALSSAALCGQTAPGIAHMWHMPGHIYSRLKRYDDAAWQQEASARVDHAHMMRDQVLPDQISNFAHNNEWLIRNLNHLGRVQDAVDLASNMVELPRHPKYNTISRGSLRYGRQRLFDTLRQYELWDKLIHLADTPYLEPTDDEGQQLHRLRRLAEACYRSGQEEDGAKLLADAKQQLEAQQAKRDEATTKAEEKAREAAVDKAKVDAAVEEAVKKAKEDDADEEAIAALREKVSKETRDKQIEAQAKKIKQAKDNAAKPFASKVRDLERAVWEIEGHQAVAAGDPKKGYDLLRKAGGVDTMYLAKVQLLAGQTDSALQAAARHVKGHKNEIQPLACQVDILWEAGKQEEAKAAFRELREISASIDDLDCPVFDRLRPVADVLELPEDWRADWVAAEDVGQRPPLESLGPFRWRPSAAAGWTLSDTKGESHSLKQFHGRPVVVVFYLGYGCLHCVEQLHKFAPATKKFAEQGIDLVAISSDDQESLSKALADFKEGDFPFPLLSNDSLDVFKAYRAYDDFEKQPLHGTFLIDKAGLVRWQDISYEPFMDVDFLLKESRRLLNQE